MKKIDDIIKFLKEERKDILKLADLNWLQPTKDVYIKKSYKLNQIIRLLEEYEQIK